MTGESCPRKASILDLTLDQVDAIEQELGIPFQKWETDGSRVRVTRAVVVALGMVTDDEARKLTLRELTELADFEDADEPDSD